MFNVHLKQLILQKSYYCDVFDIINKKNNQDLNTYEYDIFEDTCMYFWSFSNIWCTWGRKEEEKEQVELELETTKICII